MKMPSSSRYRGVVAQQSGKWGAQIYKSDNRIWLGTFRTEAEAAKTYDLAARCLHGTNAITNFNSSSFTKPNTDADDEVRFLKMHTTDEIVSMLRRQTYHDELKRRNISSNVKESRQLLFAKVVAPGDVGPQNRLLIPRQHAKKHFPIIVDSQRGVMMINFEDEKGKIWRFRYAFWGSSRTHVLNGGWAEFAREKGLRAGDKVQFWRVRNESGNMRLLIECCHNNKAKIEPPSTPVLNLPVEQHEKMIRLFGCNISASA